jgi:hypothetical protein
VTLLARPVRAARLAQRWPTPQRLRYSRGHILCQSYEPVAESERSHSLPVRHGFGRNLVAGLLTRSASSTQGMQRAFVVTQILTVGVDAERVLRNPGAPG